MKRLLLLTMLFSSSAFAGEFKKSPISDDNTWVGYEYFSHENGEAISVAFYDKSGEALRTSREKEQCEQSQLNEIRSALDRFSVGELDRVFTRERMGRWYGIPLDIDEWKAGQLNGMILTDNIGVAPAELKLGGDSVQVFEYSLMVGYSFQDSQCTTTSADIIETKIRSQYQNLYDPSK